MWIKWMTVYYFCIVSHYPVKLDSVAHMIVTHYPVKLDSVAVAIAAPLQYYYLNNIM